MNEKAGAPILFLATCSLTKKRGGESRYDENAGIVSCVGSRLGSRLLERRDEVRRSIEENCNLGWQGVPLADLEFNRDLKKGPDFGGPRTARYLRAIDRYQGRFYQALGEGGRQALGGRTNDMLIVSGLYGLVRPAEGIQLYSCPLSAEVAETWDRDSLLTDILSACIERYGVLRIFDLVAIDAYRRLIDWQRIADSGTDVLHCFDAMASGESALTSLGMFLASDLLDSTEDSLIRLKDGDRIGNVMFHSHAESPAGFPNELAELMAARNESRIFQPRHPGENVREIVRGGNPDSPPDTAQRGGGSWKFTLGKRLQNDLRKSGQYMERTVRAIVKICENPMSPQGNTVKPLRYQLQGMWRYRIGDSRLICQPDTEKQVVHFLGLRPRGEAYD